MYRVSVRSGFSASHRLKLADGRLEPPHGHDWLVEVDFAGPELDEYGLLIDFEQVQAALQSVLRNLHHTDLNEAELLRGLNPSAENVARVICDAMARRVSRPELLEGVRVEEAPGCFAAYRRWTPSPGVVDPASSDR